MDKKVLTDLVCPAKSKRRTCRKRLIIDKFITFKDDSSEVREGVLKCMSCGREYPILEGIAILMDNLKEYLRKNYYYINGLCRKEGKLSQRMHRFIMSEILKDLDNAEEKIFPKQKGYNKPTTQRFLKGINPQLCNHYNNLVDLVKKGDPFYDFLKAYNNKNPHIVVAELISKYKRNKGDMAVEIGCGVGGLVARLANSYEFVYGLDSSFETLFLARQILKGKPKRFRSFRVPTERNDYYIKKIDVEIYKNIEFICAFGDSLPFRDKSIDLVCSCNLIDVVSEPFPLLKEKMRVLRSGGLLAISSPYDFQLAIKEVKKLISKSIKIKEEVDNIPWISRNYSRNYEVYFNHTLIGIKNEVRAI